MGGPPASYWAVAIALIVLIGGTALPAAAFSTAQSAQYTFAFKDADLGDVAEAILGRSLGLTYSIDPSLEAKVSFRIDQRLTSAELLQALETTLALNDIAIVKNGSTLVLEKRARAKASSGVRSLDEGRHAIGFQTLSVPLHYASPSEVAKGLESVGAGSVVSYVNDEQNLIVLGGTGQEIDAALQTIKLFDRSSVGNDNIRWFQLERAPANSVADEVTQLIRGEHISGVSVVPLKRLNGLFAFARTSSALDEVAKWVAKLDVTSEEKSNTLWIYRPKNASAENLKAALTGVFGSDTTDASGGSSNDKKQTDSGAKTVAASTSPSGDASIASINGENIRIGVDKDTNALIIAASSSQWVQLQKLLNDLDQPPGQILIEASILEVTLTDNTQFGVDFSVIGANKKLTIGQTANASGVVGPTFPGFSIAYADSNISAAIHALGSVSSVEVVSAPKIMALDGKTASLDVGDQVPVVTQSAQSTVTGTAPLVNTVDYRNTGVILKVTPRISGGDAITLDITQEVSSVAATTTSGIDSPTILQRKLASSLRMADGQLIALGGMISSTRSKGDSGLPILKDIPGIGLLFKSSTRSLSRTELVVLLTAHIVRDGPSSDRAMADLLADMHELAAHGLTKSNH